jgi:biopolymer transport protein ExbB
VQRKKLERGLAFLGTLGNNAPFLGLFGTVIGIIMAFDRLGQGGLSGGSAPQEVMSAISEALVATAVGLASRSLRLQHTIIFSAESAAFSRTPPR